MTAIFIFVIIILAGIIIRILYFNYKLSKEVKRQEELYLKLLGQKKSSEIRLGQISENLAPFLKEFKYDSKKAHFIGMPIDYIIFEEDKVVFLEIKSGKSQLTHTQKNIKKLINEKNIVWDEMRID